MRLLHLLNCMLLLLSKLLRLQLLGAWLGLWWVLRLLLEVRLLLGLTLRLLLCRVI